jgi:addiction module HigA family antidote
MLVREFLEPLGLTQRDLAEGIGVPYQRVNEVVNGRRGVSPSTALRLAKYLGTSAEVWLSIQQRWDLYHAQRAESQALARIRRVARSRRAA